jgi:hypothetical protein
MDTIPTSVLKKGVEVLVGPISHLVNRSMTEGRVPAAFKIGRVHPIHKGKGKPGEDPASYRLVSILPALSKVLESHVKDNLENHLRKVNGLLGSQYGFRPKRSCTSALAQGQVGWLSGVAKGKVVGVMANLSAAAGFGNHREGTPVVFLLHDGRQTVRGLRWHHQLPHQHPLWCQTGHDSRAQPLHNPPERHVRVPRHRGRGERGLRG